jgi:biotin synthase
LLTRQDILAWLHEQDQQRLAELWRQADDVRRRHVGDEVHLRGLIEFSNCCRRLCAYCGLRADNAAIQRYRMPADEILACAAQAVQFGYGSVVLQSAEDPALDVQWLAEVVRQVKRRTNLAVTLSVGERSEQDYAVWRQAGADRYLLRFETSNRRLYEQIHPSLPGQRSDRIELLRTLRGLGYEIGSGVMVGIPGQTYGDLAGDIELFALLDLDMIGLGPFIPHPATPLGKMGRKMGQSPFAQQDENRELLTYKMLALARLACPRANIPSTTALATLNLAAGRELGLQRGANVVMPNLSPAPYRAMYEIYPAKACIRQTARQCHACLGSRIAAIGRRIGAGRGDSPAAARRATMSVLE